MKRAQRSAPEGLPTAAEFMPDSKPIPAAASTPPHGLAVENRVEKFLEENFKKIMVALLLLAAVLAGVFVTRHFAAKRDLEAAEMFASAAGVEDCDALIQKYPGSIAAGNALIEKADLLWQQGKKESSIAALQEFLKSQPAHRLSAAAAIALGSKQVAIGEKAAGRATLEGFLKDNPQSELAPAADIQLGDLLWQEGKDAEAKKHFDSLLQKYPGKMSVFNQALEERQQLMGAGLPQKEVAGPPPAPKSPPKPAVARPAPKWPKITLPYLRPHDYVPPSVPMTTATPPVQVPPAPPAPAARPPGDKPPPAPPKPNP